MPPDTFVKACPKKYAGELQRTRDVFVRGDVAEAALAVCAAQVDATRKWREDTLNDAILANTTAKK